MPFKGQQMERTMISPKFEGKIHKSKKTRIKDCSESEKLKFKSKRETEKKESERQQSKHLKTGWLAG